MNVWPTNSGGMVDERDQVWTGVREFNWFSAPWGIAASGGRGLRPGGRSLRCLVPTRSRGDKAPDQRPLRRESRDKDRHVTTLPNVIGSLRLLNGSVDRRAVLARRTSMTAEYGRKPSARFLANRLEMPRLDRDVYVLTHPVPRVLRVGGLLLVLCVLRTGSRIWRPDQRLGS